MPSPSTTFSMASGSILYDAVISLTRSVSRFLRRYRASGRPPCVQSHAKETFGRCGFSVGRRYNVSAATS